MKTSQTSAADSAQGSSGGSDAALVRHRIELYVEDGGWMSKDSDPKTRELFGTDTLPTPFLADTSAASVLATLREMNPDKEVVLRDAHTPGLWTVGSVFTDLDDDGIRELGYHVWVYADAAQRSLVMVTGSTREECEANARLIAAAPDLLAWFTKAVQMAGQQARGGDDVPLTSAWAWLAQHGRDAIAKAGGSS